MHGAMAGGWLTVAEAPRTPSRGGAGSGSGEDPSSRADFLAFLVQEEAVVAGRQTAMPEAEVETSDAGHPDTQQAEADDPGVIPAEAKEEWADSGRSPDDLRAKHYAGPTDRDPAPEQAVQSAQEIRADTADIQPHFGPAGSDRPGQFGQGQSSGTDQGAENVRRAEPQGTSPPIREGGAMHARTDPALAATTEKPGQGIAPAETQAPRRGRDDDRRDPNLQRVASRTDRAFPAFPHPAPAAPPVPVPVPMIWSARTAEAAAESLSKDPDLFGDRMVLGTALHTGVGPTGGPIHDLVSAMGGEAKAGSVIARQIAVAVSNASDGRSEVTLSPAELGRVRFGLQIIEGVVTVHIQTERPETLELLRRNIDALLQEFRQQGFDDATFSFTEDRQNPADQDAPRARSAPAAMGTEAPADRIALISGISQLDLRL